MQRFALALALAWLMLARAAPAAEPPPLEDYGRLPGIQRVSLSPSGQRYAMVATIGGKRRLFVANAANEPLYAEDIGATKVWSLDWAGEDHVMARVTTTVELEPKFDRDEAELASALVINVPARKRFIVFGNPNQRRVANTVAGSYGAAQIGGHWYGFFGGYTYEVGWSPGDLQTGSNGRIYPDLYRVDLDTGEFEIAAKGQDSLYDWLVGPTGEVAARLYYNQGSGDWKIVASKWSGAGLASGRSPTGRIQIVGFGRTDATVLIGFEEADREVIREVSLSSGETVANSDRDVAGHPLIDPATRRWIGSGDIQDLRNATLFAPEAQARVAGALRAFPGYIARVDSFSADFGRMVVFTEGGDDSGTYWMVDIATHAAARLGSAYPTIRRANVGPVSWFDYKAGDGLAMRGVLTLPPGAPGKALPMVVMPHGGPETHDTPGFDYWAQAFASRGYAVFQPNFRGSTGSTKAFRDAGAGEWGRKMQTDISDGVAELARRGVVDPKRACIVGADYGGYAALASVTVQQATYRCAVSYGGLADLTAFLAEERGHRGDASASARRWKDLMNAGSSAGLDDISPVRFAARADAPILLIHGKDDTFVLVNQSQRMERALRLAGKPVELVTLPGADHWLLQEDSRIAMLKASVAFVLKHNPPDAVVAGR